MKCRGRHSLWAATTDFQWKMPNAQLLKSSRRGAPAGVADGSKGLASDGHCSQGYDGDVIDLPARDVKTDCPSFPRKEVAKKLFWWVLQLGEEEGPDVVAGLVGDEAKAVRR